MYKCFIFLMWKLVRVSKLHSLGAIIFNKIWIEYCMLIEEFDASSKTSN